MNNLFRSKPAPKPVPDDFPQGPLPRALPAVATHAYEANDVLELQLRADQRLHILEAKGEWWFIARSYKKIPGTNQLEEGWVNRKDIWLIFSMVDTDDRSRALTFAFLRAHKASTWLRPSTHGLPKWQRHSPHPGCRTAP